MNNFYDLFTIEGDADLFYVFKFEARNDSYDNLPSNLAKKLDSIFDFTNSSSTCDDYADTHWDTSVLITVVFDVLNELKNGFDLDGQLSDLILARAKQISTTPIKQAYTLPFLSKEPFIYVFKNITEQECFELLLIDGNCGLSTFRKSQASDAKILRDCVWNLMWALGTRYSFYEEYSSAELMDLGIMNDDFLKFHRENVRKNISSYVSNSKESWIVENGLNSVKKYQEGCALKDSEVFEIFDLIVLIKTKTSEVFKKRFE